VQVDPTEAGSAEQRFAHESAVGDDDAEVGGELGHALCRNAREAIRFDDLDVACCLGNRCRGEHAAASLWRVFTGDDRDHVVRTGEERLEAGNGGCWAASEDEAKGGHSPILSRRERLSDLRDESSTVAHHR
jgi:hypothetical protein